MLRKFIFSKRVIHQLPLSSSALFKRKLYSTVNPHHKNMTSDSGRTLFQSQGNDYSKFRPDYPSEIFETIITFAKDNNPNAEFEVAVDMACGAGEATKHLVPYYKIIYGIDVSSSMLENAPKHPNINYSIGAVEATKLPNESIDLVLVAQALHWFDFEKFFIELDRILKPGGTFAVIGYPLNRFSNNTLANEVIQKFFYQTLEGCWSERRRILDQEYADVPFIYKETLRKHRFFNTKSMSIENYVRYIGTWSAVQTYYLKQQNTNNKEVKLKTGELKILDDLQRDLMMAFKANTSQQEIYVIFDFILLMTSKELELPKKA